jgi:hypothetical protein
MKKFLVSLFLGLTVSVYGKDKITKEEFLKGVTSSNKVEYSDQHNELVGTLCKNATGQFEWCNTIVFGSNEEIMRIEGETGKIYWHNKIVTKNEELVDALYEVTGLKEKQAMERKGNLYKVRMIGENPPRGVLERYSDYYIIADSMSQIIREYTKDYYIDSIEELEGMGYVKDIRKAFNKE